MKNSSENHFSKQRWRDAPPFLNLQYCNKHIHVDGGAQGHHDPKVAA